MAVDDTELLHIIALNGVSGVGGITYGKLMRRFGSARAVFKAGREALSGISRLPKTTIEAILTTDPVEKAEKQLEEIRKRGYDVLVAGEEGYPRLLSEIHDPPPILYVAGTYRERDELAVAMVGSRDPSDYGRQVARRLSRELASAGVTVVSGMARGIDSVSHAGAIDGGGRTIAVLGSGLDVIYPPENYKLFDRIMSNGAVMSPFPVGTRPERRNFPARNRIISGLSLGVVVVQATKPDSGSLITVRHAHEQGREVFAVPGEAGARISRATNDLIKKGHAKLVDNFKDILEEVLPQFDAGSVQVAENASESPKKAPDPNLDGDEKTVWNNLTGSPVHIDNVVRLCNLPVHRVTSALLQLELKGLVEQRPGKMFLRA